MKIEPTKQLDESIRETLDTVAENIHQVFEYVFSPTRSQGVVHGDLWNNNILFSKEVECKLVDWQFCCRMNPLVDVAFLLSSSVSVSLRKANEQEWIQIYHENLLRATGTTTTQYTLVQCEREYHEAKLYALLIMVASFDSFYEPHAEEESDIAHRYITLIHEVQDVLPTIIPK